MDGWTDLQQQLDDRNFVLSRTFTITFILLASFIFLSMFVGVMITHTEVSWHPWGWGGQVRCGAHARALGSGPRLEGGPGTVSLLKPRGGSQMGSSLPEPRFFPAPGYLPSFATVASWTGAWEVTATARWQLEPEAGPPCAGWGWRGALLPRGPEQQCEAEEEGHRGVGSESPALTSILRPPGLHQKV